MRAARARSRAQAGLTRGVAVCKSLSDKERASGGTADAKDLKSFDRKVVRVRFPPGPIVVGQRVTTSLGTERNRVEVLRGNRGGSERSHFAVHPAATIRFMASFRTDDTSPV